MVFHLIPNRLPGGVERLLLGRLLRTPQGRAFFLNRLAESEDSDELGVFDALLARVQEPRLKQLVRLHRDDEARHAQLLRACVRRNGGVPERPQSTVSLAARIDYALGGLCAAFVANECSVMEAYTVLQVIEESAVSQLPIVVELLTKLDPESAAAVRSILRDEQRHVKYAVAIAKQYEPAHGMHLATLARMRSAAAGAILDYNLTLMRLALEQQIVAVGRLEQFFLSGLLNMAPQAA
jgi:demethoxyubiquinone hydroxylase (CLK1/Coq7/Cat5 family)